MSWRVLCNQCINSPILLEIPLPQSRVLLITMVIYIIFKQGDPIRVRETVFNMNSGV